jgi:TrmH family RNA methyltransferase
MELITSVANPRVRHAGRLRNGRYRRGAGQFLVDGTRELQRAVDAGLPLQELFISEKALQGLDAADRARSDLVAHARQAGCLTGVADRVFAKLCFGDRNEGLVGRFVTPDRSLEQLPLPSNPLIVVLDQLEKPGNIGAVLRSADAAGVDAVICAEPVGDLFNPNLIRASLGTVFALPLAAAPRKVVQDWLQTHQIRSLAARVEASGPLWETNLRGPLALILGTEAEGLDASWSGPGIHIPMAGIADSLNVSVTAALLMFEAQRQRAS